MKTKRRGYITYLIDLSLREKIILTISVVLFLFLIFYIGALSPIEKGRINAEKNIKNLEMQKDSLLVKSGKSDKVAKDIYYANEKLANLKNEVPKSEEQVTLLNSIINMEKGSGVKMIKTSFTKDGKSEDGSLNIYGANISVSGNYENILEFVKLLEENNRKLQVKEVNINKGVKDYSGDISLNYFALNTKGNENE
ncbi:MAG: type 4a pilus biogenesis protein PilO [Clostridium sp.]|uniref:type 4a pilus biogenesis protein PilO n=1 Tax=Clostridium sp. TaxID=1506 RepID=UPI003F31A6BF